MPDQPPDIVLSLRHFSFRAGKKEILRDVSYAVHRGEYLAIVGPNGAGKTTLLKCIDRILTGGKGEIEVFGRRLETYSQKELARRISYVPQADGRIFPFTVREFVLMGRYPYLSPFSSIDKDGRRAADEAMALTEVHEFAERRLDTLSGGERQKVYVAAALSQGADILLLDEPTSFLDYRHQAEIRDLLARVNRASGTTIVCVTHDLNRAVLDSDRILALRPCDAAEPGSVVFCGTPIELMQADVLRDIYHTEFLLIAHPQTGLPIIAPGLPPRGSLEGNR